MQAENTKFLEYCLHISVLNLGDPIQSIPIWCGTLCIYLACLHVYLCSKSEAFTGDGGVKSIYSIFQWVFKSQRVLSPPSPGKKTNLIPPPWTNSCVRAWSKCLNWPGPICFVATHMTPWGRFKIGRNKKISWHRKNVNLYVF